MECRVSGEAERVVVVILRPVKIVKELWRGSEEWWWWFGDGKESESVDRFEQVVIAIVERESSGGAWWGFSHSSLRK